MTIVTKQFNTGGYENSNDFLFKTWEIPSILNDNDLNEIISKAKQKNIDFIIQEKTGEIDFLHVSYKHLKEKINKEGLVYQKEDKWINDLGKGIYVIEENNEVALDNLYNYIENHEDDELLLVRGTFVGTYYECIYGNEHESYICIRENIPANLLSTEIIFIDDFLFN